MDVRRIKALAKEQGKSITHLCQCINRPKYYLNDIAKESSRIISEKDLQVIADELKTTVAYIKGETDIKEKPATDDGDELSQEFKSLYCHLTQEQREIVLAAMREFVKEK